MTEPQSSNQVDPPSGSLPPRAGKEQEIQIPAGPPLLAIALATVLAAGVAAAVAARWAAEPQAAIIGALLGVFGCGFLTAGTGFIFYSPRPRPSGDCATLWMGATLARFLAVPILSLSIYFFLPADGRFAVLATAGSYLACLLAETAAVVRSINRRLNDTSS